MALTPHEKRRLEAFMADMLKFGAIRGFKFISMHLRGREEMIITIPNEPSRSSSLTSPPSSPMYPVTEFSPSSSYGAGSLTFDRSAGEPQPPASPKESSAWDDPHHTVFLLACYTKYNRPLVWVRTNEERLKALLGSQKMDQNSPLTLKSTTLWKDKDVKVWEVIGELVRSSTCPAPSNPFAVDWDYLDSVVLPERVLATGALVNILQRIIQNQTSDRSYSAKVLEDLEKLTKRHFDDLYLLIQEGGLPILTKKSQPKPQTTTPSSSNRRYPPRVNQPF